MVGQREVFDGLCEAVACARQTGLSVCANGAGHFSSGKEATQFK